MLKVVYTSLHISEMLTWVWSIEETYLKATFSHLVFILICEQYFLNQYS